MPVTIDEITAEIEPRPEPAPTNEPRSGRPSSPELELQKQRDLLARLEVRAARVRAD